MIISVTKRWDQKFKIFTVCWFLYAIAFKSNMLKSGEHAEHAWRVHGVQLGAGNYKLKLNKLKLCDKRSDFGHF